MQETTEQVAENAVPEFVDKAGRSHFPRLDYAKLKAIRDRTSLDFGNAERMARTWAELLRDDEKALTVIWIVTGGDSALAAEPSADWLAIMDGPVLESAIEAFLNALYLFTRPLRRDLLMEGAKTVQAAYHDAIADARAAVQETVNRSIQVARRSTPGKPVLGVLG